MSFADSTSSRTTVWGSAPIDNVRIQSCGPHELQQVQRLPSANSVTFHSNLTALSTAARDRGDFCTSGIRLVQWRNWCKPVGIRTDLSLLSLS